MRIVGIDPGVSGAVSLIEDGKLISVDDLPVVEVVVSKKKRRSIAPVLLFDLMAKLKPDLVILESVGVRSGEGAVGAFSFGRTFGVIEGIIAAQKIPCEYVTPATWKKAVGVPADKTVVRNYAMQLFPEFAAKFARVKDDGRAEACLIALYGVRKQNGLAK